MVRTVVVLLLLLTGAGCACTQFVQNMGKTDAYLRCHDAFMDSRGNVYVETELKRFPLNRTSDERSLGQRYLVLNAPGFQQAVEKRVAQRLTYKQRDEVRLQIHARNYLYPSNQVLAQTAVGWYMYPSDILESQQSGDLPDYLRTNQWTRFAYDRIHSLGIPATVGDRSYMVDIHVDTHGMNSADEIHQAAWAYPFKILIVPAVVLDVITFPFQFMWVMHELSKIKG